jgi:DNA polymerase elongation subunit (family B)
MSKFYTSVSLNRGDILLRGYENGERIQHAIPYKPYLFVKSRTKNSEYKTLKGVPVDKIDFSGVYEAREFIKKYKGIDGMEIFGLTNFVYTFIHDYYPGVIDYDPNQISVVSLDIETDSSGGFPDIATADKQVTAITISKKGRMVVLAYHDFVIPTEYEESVTYIKCKDEAELLEKFIQVWRSKQFLPDVLTGWNCEFFDMPYLINRINRIIGPESAKRLSPWGILSSREVEIAGRTFNIPEIVGLTILDYMQLYKKFSFTMQESYKLDHIASVVLGDRKVDYKDAGYDSLDDLYKRNFQLYIEYNIQDVRLVDRLEDKLKFIEQVFALAYDGKTNYLDTFTSVRSWDMYIHNELLSKKIVIPQFNPGDRVKDEPIEGAYVKDPQVGMHEWVVSFDLNSLYPHLIMQYNISPETYVGMVSSLNVKDGVDKILNGALNDPAIRNEMTAQNITVAATGCMFDKDYQGFLPAMMQRLYDDRVRYKQQMIEAKKKYEKTPTYELEKEIARCHNMQLAKKIQLNSVYGALGNKYFRWFDPRYAESITKSGQLSIRWMENRINEHLNKLLKTEDDYVIAVDTDSMYIKLDGFVKKTYPNRSKADTVKYLDKVCEEYFEPFIDKAYAELAEYVNAYDQKMKMKREAIADKGIWTAKKRYILNVYNNEGVQYAEPKLKIMGIEAVRSSTPAVVRNSIKKALNYIMTKTEDELIDFIASEREKFSSLKFDDVAFPRGCKELDKWMESSKSSKMYKSGTPIHVKGAIIYNYLLKEKKLLNKYESVHRGDKVKFSYLKTPNFLGEHVISTPGYLPPELELDKLIDYDTRRIFCMTIKLELEDMDDDFGFSAVSEEELKALEKQLQQEVVVKAKALEDAEATYQGKLNQLYKAIMPLLVNLAKDSEKEYIFWPGRSEKMKAFIIKVEKIVNG